MPVEGCQVESALLINPRVRAALSSRHPVVALETTAISHGLPWPDNLETAHAMAARVAAEGTLPAFIGIRDGRIRVGLEAEDLEHFASSAHMVKASRRDLPGLVASGSDGATTVAATMACAAMVGIRLFATGGIGGVHRGAESSFDISADLTELARTRVAVVCSGAKSILDIPRTLEVLETAGVPVLGFGTDRFPAFYQRESHLPVPARVDTPEQAARVIRANETLGLAGVVIANPVAESVAIEATVLEGWIDAALDAARQQSVSGRDLTPFVLERVAKDSNGRTLAANTRLLVDNAGTAASIARALTDLGD
jgi:pseudouridine-5'-phosphate glycosidase